MKTLLYHSMGTESSVKQVLRSRKVFLSSCYILTRFIFTLLGEHVFILFLLNSTDISYTQTHTHTYVYILIIYIFFFSQAYHEIHQEEEIVCTIVSLVSQLQTELPTLHLTFQPSFKRKKGEGCLFICYFFCYN